VLFLATVAGFVVLLFFEAFAVVPLVVVLAVVPVVGLDVDLDVALAPVVFVVCVLACGVTFALSADFAVALFAATVVAFGVVFELEDFATVEGLAAVLLFTLLTDEDFAGSVFVTTEFPDFFVDAGDLSTLAAGVTVAGFVCAWVAVLLVVCFLATVGVVERSY